MWLHTYQSILRNVKHKIWNARITFPSHTTHTASVQWWYSPTLRRWVWLAARQMSGLRCVSSPPLSVYTHVKSNSISTHVQHSQNMYAANYIVAILQWLVPSSIHSAKLNATDHKLAMIEMEISRLCSSEHSCLVTYWTALASWENTLITKRAWRWTSFITRIIMNWIITTKSAINGCYCHYIGCLFYPETFKYLVK